MGRVCTNHIAIRYFRLIIHVLDFLNLWLVNIIVYHFHLLLRQVLSLLLSLCLPPSLSLWFQVFRVRPLLTLVIVAFSGVPFKVWSNFLFASLVGTGLTFSRSGRFMFPRRNAFCNCSSNTRHSGMSFVIYF